MPETLPSQAVYCKLGVGGTGRGDISGNSGPERAGDRTVWGDHTFIIADLWHPMVFYYLQVFWVQARLWLFGNSWGPTYTPPPGLGKYSLALGDFSLLLF